MQTDVWYDLALRELIGGDDAAQALVREAEAASQGGDETEDAEDAEASC